MADQPRKIILKSGLCPGDVTVLTGAVESLHRQYPGQFLTDYRGSCSELWDENPRITKLSEFDDACDLVPTSYEDGLGRSHIDTLTFMGAYAESLGKALGVSLRAVVNRPFLFLSEQEQGWMNQVAEHALINRSRPFWLINAGSKTDYTAKQWPLEYYQQVVTETLGEIQWVQIAAREHNHARLGGAIDFRGKTDTRQLVRLVYHCTGGIGPVTFLQHLCAAWSKPYVAIVGGREPAIWNCYPKQMSMNAVGQLNCCRDSACWRSRVVPLGDNDKNDSSLCEWPIIGMEKPVAKCMAMIKPEEVIMAVRRMNSECAH